MKVQIKINASTIIEVEGNSPKELVEKVSAMQDVFGYDKCGMCGAPARLVHRIAQGYHFYEAKCTDRQRCGAALKFGQPKDAPDWLFPQRKDKDGNWKKNNGWEIYRGGNDDQHQSGPSDQQYHEQGGYEA